jgi:polyisoprenoid-binding protein YceI
MLPMDYVEQRMKCLLGALAVLGLGPLLCGAQEAYRLDPTNSVIWIRLGTAGELGFMGHPHLIKAPLERGDFMLYPGDLSRSTVAVVVDAGALRVVDPKRSAKERKEIQSTMQSERVLGITQYPKIVFKSSKIEPLDGNRLQVTGNLTIRSNAHPVVLRVRLEYEGPQLKATGECRFKQTTFGMQPVAAGLGTVRVRDEVSLSFEVAGQLRGGGR